MATYSRLLRVLVCVSYLIAINSAAKIAPSQADIDDFASSLTNSSIAQVGDPAYEQAIRIDNGRFLNTTRPLLIVDVSPVSPVDIYKSAVFALHWNLPFSVKGGGHSAAGYCLNSGGVVVSMHKFKTIVVDATAKLLHLGAGVTWMEVYQALEDAGITRLLPVGGACPTVGIAGFTLGGGYSFLSRSLGMGVDSLVAAVVVPVRSVQNPMMAISMNDDDVLLNLNDSATDPHAKDLWWALRGGGGGNFAITTQITVRLHDVNVTIFEGTMLFCVCVYVCARVCVCSFRSLLPDLSFHDSCRRVLLACGRPKRSPRAQLLQFLGGHCARPVGGIWRFPSRYSGALGSVQTSTSVP